MFIGCKNIHKSFMVGNVETHILKGISIEIKHKEFVAIMGSSGSGKSTLLYLLGLLDEPDMGEIIYDDVIMNSKKAEDKTKIRLDYIGYVFQDFYLIDEMKIYENVALSGIASKMPLDEAYSRAKELLEIVGLANHINKKPTQLSGGQKQRVAIARALMNNPHVLYADEPTANLDSVTSMEIFHLFKKLQKELKLTIIMVTHETDFKDKVDRVIMIKDGKIK